MSNGPLTLQATARATGLHASCAAGKGRGQKNIAALSKGTLSTGNLTLSLSVSNSLQTLSKGGKGRLSGPQQYVAVQRPALPLQEGRMSHQPCPQFISNSLCPV